MAGAWVWAAFIYMSIFTLICDQILPAALSPPKTNPDHSPTKALCADALLLVIGLCHLFLYPFAIWVICNAYKLQPWQSFLFFLSCGYWMGQVMVPAAHELIHRTQKPLFYLGALLYISILFGHHTSAHRLVHHHKVATPNDPNSAPEGMGFWRFYPRAWIGSFKEGFRAENTLRSKRTLTSGTHIPPHPYVFYVLGALGALGVAYFIGGVFGVFIWMGLAAHAQIQLLLADYVQHYGLKRAILADGRIEPVRITHSWNSPHWFSSALMFNAPRHSDHHIHPMRPYPILQLTKESPLLPWPLPFACMLALFPKLWRKKMKPHLQYWSKQHRPN